MKAKKTIDQLTAEDIVDHPVWQFSSTADPDETALRPVTRLPVTHLRGRVVAEQIKLANGVRLWALIGNVLVDNPELTKHIVTLSILRNGLWYHLPRYHDSDYGHRGPSALAEFLELPLKEVFPISYDVRRYCKAKSKSLTGSIEANPSARFTRTEIIKLAVPRNPGRIPKP